MNSTIENNSQEHDKDFMKTRNELSKIRHRLNEQLLDLDAFVFLLDSSIYRSGVINLFENLENYKSICRGKITRIEKLNEQLKSQIEYLEMTKKPEEKSLEDPSKNDDLVQEGVKLIAEIFDLKSHIYPFLKSVIMS